MKSFGLFNKTAGDAGGQAPEALNPVLIDMVSRYVGPARQRQLLFGELVVGNQNWDVDLGAGVILFGDDEYPAQLLGTESDSSGTWLWGYLNRSGFPADVLEDSKYAHNFCKAAVEFAPDEPILSELVNGHNIAAISVASRQEKICYYRCPYHGGAAFMLVGDIPDSVFASVDAAKVIGVISDLIRQLPLNHKILAKSLLSINCASISETETGLTGIYEDGTNLTISFDELERIKFMNTTP